VAWDTAKIYSISSTHVTARLPFTMKATAYRFQIRVKDASPGGDSVVSAGNHLDHCILLDPTHGGTYRTGDTVHVTWRNNTYMYNMMVCFGWEENLHVETLTDDMAVYYPLMSYDWVIGAQKFALPDTVTDGVILLRGYTDPCFGPANAPGLWGDRSTVPIRILK
jgi:hypothetical protein